MEKSLFLVVVFEESFSLEALEVRMQPLFIIYKEGSSK